MKHLLGFSALALVMAGSVAVAAPVTTVQSMQQGSALVTVDTATPGTVLRSTTITGIPVGVRLIGLAERSAGSRALYGVGSNGQTYFINGFTGIATPLGAPLTLTGFPAHAGVSFNPTVDRIRVVTDANQSLRLNPDTGAVAANDAAVAYAPGDSGVGINPNVGGAAYTNNVPGATTTTLYVIDTNRAVLATQGNGTVSPNSGQLFTVGNLAVNTGANAGLAISGSGQSVAILSDKLSGTEAVYSINLTSGTATLIGLLPAGSFNGLAFTATPLGQIGLTQNQQNVGGVLDRFVGLPSAGLISLFGALDTLPTDADRAAALGQLGPGSFARLPELVFQSSDSIDQTLRRYQRDARARGTDDSATAVRFGADRKIGMFLVGNGRFGYLGKDTAGGNRTSYGATGAVGGIDYRLTDKILVGGFGGYDMGRARLDRYSAQSDIDTWYAGGYASLGYGPIYVDAHGSYGKTDFNLRRTVAFGNYSQFNSAKTKSENWAAAGTVGASVKFMGLEAEPYGGVTYTHVRLDDFSERTAQLTSLAVFGRHGIESLQAIGGLRLGAAIPIAGTQTTVRPSIRGEYRHEFDDTKARTLTAVLGDPGVNAPFLFTTTPLARDFAAIGAGFTVSGASPLSLVVDYNGEVGKDRSIHGVTGGVRLSF